MRLALASSLIIILTLVGVAAMQIPSAEEAQAQTRWEYARWIEGPGLSIWMAIGHEQYGTTIYETYRGLGGLKVEGVFGKPSAKDEMLNHAGSLGWELCGVDSEGSTVYFFKRPIARE